VAASLLHAIGLDELVTASPAEYEALAVKIAMIPALLSRSRRSSQRTTAPMRCLTLTFSGATSKLHSSRCTSAVCAANPPRISQCGVRRRLAGRRLLDRLPLRDSRGQ
jgi:hypothetical protein